jgi:hypothetical protein
MFGLKEIVYLLLLLLTLDDLATAVDSDTAIPVRVNKFNSVVKRTNELAHYNTSSQKIQELDEAERELELCDTFGYCYKLPPKCNRKRNACKLVFKPREWLPRMLKLPRGDIILTPT